MIRALRRWCCDNRGFIGYSIWCCYSPVIPRNLLDYGGNRKDETHYNLKRTTVDQFSYHGYRSAEAIPAAISKQLDKPNTFILMLEIYDGTRLAVITLITIVLVYTY